MSWVTSKYPPVLEGWLEKEGHIVKNWKKRFFILEMKTRVLRYYRNADLSYMAGEYHIDSKSIVTTEDDRPKLHIFNVISLKAMKIGEKETILFMCANTLEERDRWLGALQEAISGVRIYQPELMEKEFTNSCPLTVTFPGGFCAHDGKVVLPFQTLLRTVTT